MSRDTGTFKFSGNFDVQKAAPIDNRSLVNSFSDLTKAETWKNAEGGYYTYIGMVVACKDRPGELYQLTASDYTLISNWKLVSSSDLYPTPTNKQTAPLYTNLTELEIASETVFASGTDGGASDKATRRIPSVVITENYFVTACEARTSVSDSAQIDILIGRKELEGTTWSYNTALVYDTTNSYKYMNPSMVVDRSNNRIYLFSMRFKITDTNKGSWINLQGDDVTNVYRYSDDEGATWSEIVGIGTSWSSDWKFSTISTSNSLIMDDGTIVCPCMGYHNTNYARSGIVYKKKDSSTWVYSSPTPVNGENECTIFVNGSTLYVNTRNSTDVRRVYAYNFDTDTFTKIDESFVPNNACEAAIENCTIDDMNFYIMSFIDVNSNIRANPTVWISADGVIYAKTINLLQKTVGGTAGYCITTSYKNYIAALYEDDGKIYFADLSDKKDVFKNTAAYMLLSKQYILDVTQESRKAAVNYIFNSFKVEDSYQSIISEGIYGSDDKIMNISTGNESNKAGWVYFHIDVTKYRGKTMVVSVSDASKDCGYGLTAQEYTTTGNTYLSSACGTGKNWTITNYTFVVPETAVTLYVDYMDSGDHAYTPVVKVLKGVIDPIKNLDVAQIGSDSTYIKNISESDGKISATSAELNTSAVTRTATEATDTKVAVDGTNVEEAIESLATSIKSIGSITVDSELSDTSENPVQNKVITTKVTSLESQVATNTADIKVLKSYHTTDLSMVDIYGAKLSAQSTANCYVVKEAGDYKLPLVYGNAIKDGAENTAAYTNLGTNSYMMNFVNAYGNQITSPYIETDTGKSCAEAQFSIGDADIFTNLSVSDGYLYFTVSDVPVTGANGVLSVKDSDGNIMWNWHIWVFPYDLTPVTITNSTGVNYDIMPVYLATTYDDGDDTKRKNWFYQWGRSVPTLGPAAYNSTTNATSYGVLSFANKSNSGGAYQQGILNPTTFWTKSSTPYNWFGTSPYYNLWDANCSTTGCSDNTTVKTVYDPSPVGFKIPNGNVFSYFSASNVVGSFSNGLKFKKNSSDTTGIFFPASGYRYSSGSIINVSTFGDVWTTATYSYNYAYMLDFASSNVYPQNSNYRAYGFSVCCVAEL